MKREEREGEQFLFVSGFNLILKKIPPCFNSPESCWKQELHGSSGKRNKEEEEELIGCSVLFPLQADFHFAQRSYREVKWRRGRRGVKSPVKNVDDFASDRDDWCPAAFITFWSSIKDERRCCNLLLISPTSLSLIKDQHLSWTSTRFSAWINSVYFIQDHFWLFIRKSEICGSVPCSREPQWTWNSLLLSPGPNRLGYHRYYHTAAIIHAFQNEERLTRKIGVANSNYWTFLQGGNKNVWFLS